MPKELCHWFMAEEVFSSIKEKELQKLLKINRSLYFYGSVAYDTPYYYQKKIPAYGRCQGASVLHGLDHLAPLNPIDPYLKLLAVFPEFSAPLFSFLAGALVHRQTDLAFHPLVVYFSGYDDVRHHQIESLLDLHVLGKQDSVSPVPGTFLENLFSELNDYKRLASFLGYFYSLPEKFHLYSLEMLKSHCTIQRNFFKRKYYYSLSLLSVFLPQLRSRSSLYYPDKEGRCSDLFIKEFKYQNPWSGEEIMTSLDKIVSDLTEKSQKELLDFYQLWQENKLEEFFSSLAPLNLLTGKDYKEPRQDPGYVNFNQSIAKTLGYYRKKPWFFS